MSVIDNILWVGTGNASIHVFKLSSAYSEPSERVQQIAQASKKDPTEELNYSLRVIQDDVGLLGKRKESFTLPVRRSVKTTTHVETNVKKRREDRRMFGEGFQKRSRQEYLQELKNEGVYEMEHLWSSKIYPGSQECLRVTVMKQIKYVLFSCTIELS